MIMDIAILRTDLNVTVTKHNLVVLRLQTKYKPAVKKSYKLSI